MSSGDIWSTGAFAFESPLKDLLDTQNYTLEDLLAEDELLQELRGLHPTLVSYFSKEENVTGLIRYLVDPPITFQEFLFTKAKQKEHENKIEHPKEVVNTSKNERSSADDDTSQSGWLLEKTSEAIREEVDGDLNPREEFENISIRFPYMACEVVCCEISDILDVIVVGCIPSNKGAAVEQEDKSSETILDLLFSMLYTTPQFQLDDRRAGYLEKILSMLFRTRRDAMTAYINGDHLIETTLDECNERTVTVPNHRGGGEALLRALFRQLHSNSIAQIVQHMFMPKPQSFAQGNDEQIEEKDHDEYPSDDNDEMGSDLDYFCGIHCKWADSCVGAELLLEGLFVDEEDHSEAQLNASQHSSEILTLVIQHSQLDSNMMKMLVSGPILSKLIQSACGSDDSNLSPPATFNIHESTMTTAMNVLEIFILQLGGYGTIPTEQHEGEHDLVKNSDTNSDLEDAKAATANNEHQEQSEQMKLEVAQSLISYLPPFLACLSQLLTHPDTAKWTTPCQFSNIDQPMLGSSRLRIVRLIESLVLLSIREVDLLLCGSDCLQICLDLFWAFPWCSMLHQSVANLLVHVLEGGEDRIDLQMYFLRRCNLPRRLMDSFLNPSFSSSVNLVDHAESVKATSSPTVIKMNPSDESDSLPYALDTPTKVYTGTMSTMQENAGAISNKAVQHNECSTSEQIDTVLLRKESKENPRNQLPFRLGYMGHVIIICQALLHACEEVKRSESTNKMETSSEFEGQEDDQGADNLSLSNRKNITLSLLQGMPCYSDWLTFVNTTLASETAVQSTPLGGYYAAQAENNGDHATESTWNTACEYDDVENEVGHSHPYIVSSEEIDLDDTDLDIAASMMESMNLPGSDENGKSQGHRRQRGVISGQELSKRADFGTVVDVYKASTDYVFDDPLGSQNQFDVEEDEVKYDINNDVDDDDAPVMDLFAGNFEIPCDDQNIDTGWANFDDAFADASPFPDMQSSAQSNIHEYIANDEGNSSSSSEDELEDNQ